MTPRQRTIYTNEFHKALEAIETRYVVRVFAALRTQFKNVARSVREGRGVELGLFNQPVLNVLQSMQKVAGVMMARRTLTGLNAVQVKRTMGFNQEWTDEIIRYFRAHNLEMVQKIDATSRAHILRILERGTTEGLSVDEMAKLINDELYLAHRAARIVRTESTRAANHGVQMGAAKYAYQTVKEWSSVRDNRTRHTHVTVNGQQREEQEVFSNGLLFPGDPQGPAAETVNCRCVMAIVPKRDANDKLIPKRSISLILPGDFNRSRQIIAI